MLSKKRGHIVQQKQSVYNWQESNELFPQVCKENDVHITLDIMT